MSVEIISRGDTVTLPSGVVVPRPTRDDYDKEFLLTKQQEELFNEIMAMQSNDEANMGRASQIQRIVADLEMQKHPLLRTHNKHLMPERAPRTAKALKVIDDAVWNSLKK